MGFYLNLFLIDIITIIRQPNLRSLSVIYSKSTISWDVYLVLVIGYINHLAVSASNAQVFSQVITLFADLVRNLNQHIARAVIMSPQCDDLIDTANSFNCCI